MRLRIAALDAPPKWNDDEKPLKEHWQDYKAALEQSGVFFSSPLDLDLSMVFKFPKAYGATSSETDADEDDIKAVLGKKYHGVGQYPAGLQKLFVAYHKLFKLGSKPAAHINALANLDDDELLANAPLFLTRLVDAVIAKIKGLPE